MNLEQQVANLVTAASNLTAEVAGKQSAIDARVAAKITELEAWRQGVRAEYPAVNLLANSRFKVDTNGDGLPDGFFTYYAAGGTASYALVTPDAAAAAGSDAKIAADLVAFGPGADYFTVSKVLKVTLPASTVSGATDIWSLNASVPILRGLISRGIYYYAKTQGAANIRMYEQPGADAQLIPEYNKPVKACHSLLAGTTEIPFLIAAMERTAPLTLFLAAPWISTGYSDHVPSSIEGR